jgi:transposase
VFTACADTAGVTALRRGALERVALLLTDWRDTRDRLADTENRMVAVLDELGLTALATSITGLSAVGAASVLAETSHPARFTTGRALVKHSGLAPRQKISGTYTGRTRTTGQVRPGLRLAGWRAVWGALKSEARVSDHHPHQVAGGVGDRYWNLPDRHVGARVPASRAELWRHRGATGLR